MEREPIKPISPEEVAEKKKRILPNEVLEAFNELIALNFSGSSACILQKDIVKLLVKKGLSQKTIYENHFLDVEEVYMSAGWKVTYDKPGYNEDYEPTFTFSRKRRNIDDD